LPLFGTEQNHDSLGVRLKPVSIGYTGSEASVQISFFNICFSNYAFQFVPKASSQIQKFARVYVQCYYAN